jgi:hypothetical protein
MTRQNTINAKTVDISGTYTGEVPPYSVGDFLSLVGLLNFAARVVVGARSRVSSLCAAVPHAARIDFDRHDDPAHLTHNNLEDLRTVVEMISNHDWFSCTVHKFTEQIYTDASIEKGDCVLGYSNGL